MCRIRIGAFALALSFSSAQAQPNYSFAASPSGSDNGRCTSAQPCSPQGAVKACPIGAVCGIELQAGIYENPAVNIYYHRTIMIKGDCNNPYAVLFRGTTPNTPLIWVQDHATAIVKCLSV